IDRELGVVEQQDMAEREAGAVQGNERHGATVPGSGRIAPAIPAASIRRMTSHFALEALLCVGDA
ncbi:MAG: hypothetical protein ACREUZ_05790, partial [Burkholderiales bacterium]